MAAARARRAAPLRAQRVVAQQPLQQAAVAGIVDLAREVLEEAVELVDVAVGDREERGRVGALGARDRAHLDLQLVAEALDAARDPHEVAALEAAGQHVGVAERARPRSRPCGRAARARGTATPERAVSRSLREHAKTASTASPARRAATARGRGGGDDANTGPRGGRGTVDPMQPLRWERRPDGLRAPALVCAFKGWNDAGESATSALAFIAGSLGAERVRDDRPGGVRRLPVHAPDGAAGRRRHARDRLAGVRDPRGADPARAARPRAALRPRARDALADVLAARSSTSPRRSASRWRSLLGALLADVPHSRPVAVTAHASDPG